jgi:hypothetical protein
MSDQHSSPPVSATLTVVEDPWSLNAPSSESRAAETSVSETLFLAI